MCHIDDGYRLEEFARQMVGTSAARGCHCELARIGFRIGDELVEVVGWECRIHVHHVGQSHYAGDRDAASSTSRRSHKNKAPFPSRMTARRKQRIDYRALRHLAAVTLRSHV